MSTNLRIIQEYYSKIQLKYNETIVSLKQKDETDNHYIMFKDQFPEFNNLMLDFFNIVPSYYNFIDLKNLADKIKEKITGEESIIIKTFKELMIGDNNINLMRDEIDKYLEEQQKKSIDTLKYIHNKLITEDLSPLSSRILSATCLVIFSITGAVILSTSSVVIVWGSPIISRYSICSFTPVSLLICSPVAKSTRQCLAMTSVRLSPAMGIMP